MDSRTVFALVPTFQIMAPEQRKQRQEYFRNNLLPILSSQQRRKELGADEVKKWLVD